MDDELEQLREQTSTGDRLDEASAEQDQHELQEAILTELEAIDAGEKQKTVSVWDGPVAALLGALEDRDDDLVETGEQLRDALGVEADDEPDRSEVLRLALRLGFETGAPDKLDATRAAVEEHASQRL
jgi:sirohydrochlorin ferrochelatase